MAGIAAHSHFGGNGQNSAIEGLFYGRGCLGASKFMRFCGRGSACRFWRMVMRVSLSDWLAFQARIRGSKDPRLLRDRPTDVAAWAAKIYAGCGAHCM